MMSNNFSNTELGNLFASHQETENARASINDEDHNLAFKFNDFMLSFDDGKISVFKGRKIFAQYAISDFSRSPNAVFRRMQRDMTLQAAAEES